MQQDKRIKPKLFRNNLFIGAVEEEKRGEQNIRLNHITFPGKEEMKY